MSPVIALGGAVVAAGFAAYAAKHPAAQIWGRGFYRGPREGRLLALTFDDGPNDATEPILDLLAEYGAPATFFVCGRNVERRPQPSRRALAEGHEIGNHTYSHRLLLGLRSAEVWDELERCQRVVEDRLNIKPTLFRPPYGVRSPWLRRALDGLGLTAVQWTVIARDWKWHAERVAQYALTRVGPGGILCLHDGSGAEAVADRRQTVAALAMILPKLKAQGYRFVTAGAMRQAGAAGPP